jgi:hypothetical protein
VKAISNPGVRVGTGSALLVSMRFVVVCRVLAPVAVALLATACTGSGHSAEGMSSASTVGTVCGQIIQVGGPSGTPNQLVHGVVTLTNVSSGFSYRASSGRPNGYSIEVPAGTYDVIGISLDDYSDGHPMRAYGALPIVVTDGATARANLFVQIR